MADFGMRRSGRDRMSLERRMAVAGLALVAPAAIYTLIFGIGPLLYGLYLSFTSYDPLDRAGPRWHGLDGYREVLASPDFWRSLRVTIQYSLEVIPPAVMLALALAMLVNRPLRGIAVFRAMLYLPRIVSLVSVSLIWLWLYSRDGLFNAMGEWVGAGDTPWLTSPDHAIHSIAVMRIWKALGGNMVLFLAGLQNIPKELYEAAEVDGAGAWAKFRYITLPGLRPVMVYVVTINIIYIMQSFAEIYVMTGGGPLDSTTTVNLLIYREAFQYNRIGQASAMAFLLFALIFAFAFMNVRRMGRKGGR
jgi:multiple sugar transport system permease protein